MEFCYAAEPTAMMSSCRFSIWITRAYAASSCQLGFPVDAADVGFVCTPYVEA